MSGPHFGGDFVNVNGTGNIGKIVGSPEPAAPGWAADPHRSRLVWTEPLVFVNYRSADEKAAADLEKELNRRLGDGAVFRDVHMPAGIVFPCELADRAAHCEVMISIIGERWDDTTGLRLLNNHDDWVRREIATALANDVHVVPILIGARRRLTGNSLPEDVRQLAYLQGPHLLRNYTEADIQRLVDDLLSTVRPLAAAMYRNVR